MIQVASQQISQDPRTKSEIKFKWKNQPCWLAGRALLNTLFTVVQQIQYSRVTIIITYGNYNSFLNVSCHYSYSLNYSWPDNIEFSS